MVRWQQTSKTSGECKKLHEVSYSKVKEEQIIIKKNAKMQTHFYIIKIVKNINITIF